MSEQETVQERVQAALAHLPRPIPPPRLHRAVMAQARREADALPVQTWSRTESDGWATEWRHGPDPKPLPACPTPSQTTVTQWRQESGNRVTTYQMIRTH